MTATIKHLATALKLSTATISRALNNDPNVKAKTKAKVLAEVTKQNYEHNKIAASLRSGKSKTIGVVVPSIEMNFFGNIIHGIEKIAFQNNYYVLLTQSNELEALEQRSVQTLLNARVDCIMASVAKETTDLKHFQNILNKNIPLILFDRIRPELNVPMVMIDDEKGAYQMTLELIKAGCKKIAHIGGPQHIPIFKNRLKGYLKALKKKGLTIYPDMFIPEDLTIDGGERACEQLFSKKIKPDGIFCVEDYTALGALQYLKQVNILVPKKVKVAGFANEKFSQYITPQLSTVDQFTVQMGEAATQLFLNLYVHKKSSTTINSQVVLQPQIILRESTK